MNIETPAITSPPEHLIGAPAVERLRQAGLVIVPLAAICSMREAASQAMRKRQMVMGEDWVYVSNKQKAAIRWNAMIEAYYALCRPSESSSETIKE